MKLKTMFIFIICMTLITSCNNLMSDAGNYSDYYIIKNVIRNGSFEGGSIIPWKNDRGLLNYKKEFPDYVYEGNYSYTIGELSSGNMMYSEGYLEQNVNLVLNSTAKISFWHCWDDLDVEIYYDDEMYDEFNYPYVGGTWTKHEILSSMLSGENIKKIRFLRKNDSNAFTIIDNIFFDLE